MLVKIPREGRERKAALYQAHQVEITVFTKSGLCLENEKQDTSTPSRCTSYIESRPGEKCTIKIERIFPSKISRSTYFHPLYVDIVIDGTLICSALLQEDEKPSKSVRYTWDEFENIEIAGRSISKTFVFHKDQIKKQLRSSFSRNDPVSCIASIEIECWRVKSWGKFTDKESKEKYLDIEMFEEVSSATGTFLHRSRGKLPWYDCVVFD